MEKQEEVPQTIQEMKEETEEMSKTDWNTVFQNMELADSPKKLDETNPIMTQRYGADPYAMVYGDTVYFYMTADVYEYDSNMQIKDNSYGKIKTINVVSTKDMVNFTDHGAVAVTKAATWANNSWAPAAAWKNIDGQDKFFLYFADGGGGIGVLTADSPTGPFTDPIGKGLLRRDMPNCGNVLWLFDPAVLVDDDGSAYIYFGGGVPEGKVAEPGTGRVAKLGADMISIEGEPVALHAPYLFEDSGIHKYNNKYYYTYCSNWQVDQAGTDKYGFHNAEIVCMESDSPMGPFEYKETILKNPGQYCGLYGNNHHCVFTFEGRWYMTYHSRALEKRLGVEKGYRATNVNEFIMNADGSIGTIDQSAKGREQLHFVNPYEAVNATTVQVLAGCNTAVADEKAANTGCGEMALGNISDGAFIKVSGVDFGNKEADKLMLSVRKSSGEDQAIAVKIDDINSEPVCIAEVAKTSQQEFETLTYELSRKVSGVHDLYFVFAGSGYQIRDWSFAE